MQEHTIIYVGENSMTFFFHYHQKYANEQNYLDNENDFEKCTGISTD
jgi:hypothetical protein